MLWDEDGTCLYIKKRILEEGTRIINPNDYKKDKKDKVHISDYKVSEDNKYIAFSLSYNGSDWREIRVKSLYPFRDQDDVLTGVKFSNIAWSRDGFFYTKYPQQGNILKEATANPSICYHKLGTAQHEDQVIHTDPQHPLNLLAFKTVSSGNYLLIYNNPVDSINGGEKLVLVTDLRHAGTFKTDTLIVAKQKVLLGVIGLYKNKFVTYTTDGAAKGKLVLYEKDKKNKEEDFIPEHTEKLHMASVIGNKIVCTYLSDIDYINITYDSSGKAVNKIAFPPGTSVGGFGDDYTDSTTIFYFYSFLHPPIVYEYNVNRYKVNLVEQTKLSFDHKDFVMEKVYYNSKDGAKIPMIIAHKKGMKKDGKNPTLLYGYGGYGIVMTPSFNAGFISFMQNGGVVALPCIRGGGEYGEDWHTSGSMFNKQNVFDDFIGAAEFLFRENYTSRDNLAIMGGSNGGLLVAAVLNQRPDICKAAIAGMGVYDMLRYQKFTIGKAWEQEYGTSSDSLQFQNLYKYSPLHNIKDTAYPAVLVITADHDDRVVPLHSYKYVATLQKKNKSANPVLMYIEKNGGHGAGGADAESYIYSFIYEQLGLPPKKIHNLYY